MSKFTSNIKDFLFNVGYNIQLAPTMVEINAKANSVNHQKQKQQTHKEDLEKKLEISKQKQLDEIYGKTPLYQELSEEFRKKIVELVAKNSGTVAMELKLSTKAVQTNKWIEYACYCIMNDSPKIIRTATREEMELVNAIAELAQCPKIYATAGVSDLRQYDPDYPNYDVKKPFILSIKEINNRMKNPVFQPTKKAVTEREVRNENRESDIVKQVFDSVPFKLMGAIGFRCVQIQKVRYWRGDYGSRHTEQYAFAKVIEFINVTNSQVYYLYDNKKAVDEVNKIAKTNRSYMCMEDNVYYTAVMLEKILNVLERYLPRFEDVVCIYDEGEYAYSECKITLESVCSFKSGLAARFVSAKEFEKLDENVQDNLIQIYVAWSEQRPTDRVNGDVIQYWKSTLQSLGKLIDEKKKAYQENFEKEKRENEQSSRDGKFAAGDAGEKEVVFQLQTGLPDDYILVNNGRAVVLKHPGNSSLKHEIDHIVIGPQGIFAIETKAWSGKIEIDEQGNWMRTQREETRGERNPVGQVNRHHLAIEKILGIRDIFDIICIANDEAIIVGSKNSGVPIVKSDMLAYYMQGVMNDNGKIYSEEEKKELMQRIENCIEKVEES